MERRSRLVACALVAALFVAGFACNKAERAKSASQASSRPQAQRAGTFMPPYYADVRGISVPQTLYSALWAEKWLKERASLATIRQEIVDHYSGEYGRR